jgi:hypothetical protein
MPLPLHPAPLETQTNAVLGAILRHPSAVQALPARLGSLHIGFAVRVRPLTPFWERDNIALIFFTPLNNHAVFDRIHGFLFLAFSRAALACRNCFS